jgi:hypothetical protein
MPSITPNPINEKSLTNLSSAGDILVDEATMTVDEAEQPVDSVGHPITKGTINEKSLTPLAENI